MNELVKFVLMFIIGIPWAIAGIAVYTSYCGGKNSVFHTFVVGVIVSLVGDVLVYLYGSL